MDLIIWLNENNGFLLVILTAVYVIATIITVRKMAKSNEIAQNSMEIFAEFEKDKSRPTVVFKIEPTKIILLEVNIKNIGVSTAYNIKVKTDPEIRRFDGDEKIKFISEGIPSLPPGSEISTIIGSFEEFTKAVSCKVVTGFIEYERLDKKKYKEEFHIDLSLYEGTSKIREKGAHEIAKELEKIKTELSHLTSGFKKPLVRTISETEYQEQQNKIHEEAEKRLLEARKQKKKK